MSSRTMSGRTWSFGVQQKAIRFRIMANGAWTSPVLVGGRGTNATLTGVGIPDGVTSVVRNSAGKFTVTLDDAYAKLETVQATYQGSGDAEDIVAQIGTISNVGTSTPVTVVVKTKTGATNTDPGTTDANTSISVELIFEDSSA